MTVSQSANRTARFLSAAVVVASALSAGSAAYAQGGAAGDAAPSGFVLSFSATTQSREIGEDVNLGTAAEWERGFGVSAMLGYRTPYGLRVEFESSVLDNNNVGFHFPPYPNGFREESSGHVTLRSYMFNVSYDVPLGQFAPSMSRVQPFAGFGLGATESRINGVTSATLQSGIPGVFAPTVLDTASRFTQSWQVRVGIGVRATERLEVFGAWRHFETDQLNFKTIQFPDVQVRGANIDGLEGGIRLFLF
jgi:opacity protein-like surface antigen